MAIILDGTDAVGDLGDALAAKADAAATTSALAAKAALAGATYTGTHDFTSATVTGIPAGLALITTQSFTTASAVNVNNCFTSAYENYLIIGDGLRLTTGSDIALQMRLRVSGADNSTSNYAWAQGYVGSTSGGSGSMGTTSYAVGNFDDGSDIPLRIDVGRPQIAAQTLFQSRTFNLQASQVFSNINTGVFLSTTQFDGFSLIPASSTITGTVRIYGYQN